VHSTIMHAALGHVVIRQDQFIAHKPATMIKIGDENL